MMPVDLEAVDNTGMTQEMAEVQLSQHAPPGLADTMGPPQQGAAPYLQAGTIPAPAGASALAQPNAALDLLYI